MSVWIETTAQQNNIKHIGGLRTRINETEIFPEIEDCILQLLFSKQANNIIEKGKIILRSIAS